MRRKIVNQVVTWKINSQHPGEGSCLSPQKNGLENHASLKSLESKWHPEDCISLYCISIKVKFLFSLKNKDSQLPTMHSDVSSLECN
jgi:hypothetical protein